MSQAICTIAAMHHGRGGDIEIPHSKPSRGGGWGFRGSRHATETNMQQRLDAMKISPAAYKALAVLENYVEQSGLEQSLLDLVKIRASQINGCAYCLVMHTNDARKHGESDERMFLLDAWHEAPVFTARERAALGWVEAITKVSETHVPDEVYQQTRRQFSEKEMVDLTAAAIAINSWNRVAIAMRATPPLTKAKIAA
jgi:AhpD family alkylhydroperoxidase